MIQAARAASTRYLVPTVIGNKCPAGLVAPIKYQATGCTSIGDWPASGYPRASVAGGPISFCPTSVSTTATRWPASRQYRVRKRQYVLFPRSTAPRTRILRHLCCTIWPADHSQAEGISNVGSIEPVILWSSGHRRHQDAADSEGVL